MVAPMPVRTAYTTVFCASNPTAVPQHRVISCCPLAINSMAASRSRFWSAIRSRISPTVESAAPGVLKDAAYWTLLLSVAATHKASGRVSSGYGNVLTGAFAGRPLCLFRTEVALGPVNSVQSNLQLKPGRGEKRTRSRTAFLQIFPPGNDSERQHSRRALGNRTSTPKERTMCRWDSRWTYRVCAAEDQAVFPASGRACTAASNSAAVPDQTPFRS